ncbi:uncharacterized protein LOC119100514 [Pollicipes pollicipes]|uniref:uncharacterized protein LOC119100514 n=1 Tax=Pollicipes pollicipes TaxID=41117 RepID=UPI00188547DA|nr:uncharacterized protein LOC119100514 [Pollicipes pollicipes]
MAIRKAKVYWQPKDKFVGHVDLGAGDVDTRVATNALVFMAALYDLQHSEGIRAANKLSRLHVQYEKNKMKVKLAAQLFSSSVGKALLYLEESGHYDFIGAGATARFVLLVDQAFDYLNGSNPHGKSFKTPATASNLTLRREFLADFSSVLFRLQTASGEPVL